MISLDINNTPSNSKTINSTANSVNLQLQTPILLDQSKKYQLRVLNANIVYCENNITILNNKFTYTYNSVTCKKHYLLVYIQYKILIVQLQDIPPYRMGNKYSHLYPTKQHQP